MMQMEDIFTELRQSIAMTVAVAFTTLYLFANKGN